jgi:hypothetical protein
MQIEPQYILDRHGVEEVAEKAAPKPAEEPVAEPVEEVATEEDVSGGEE